MHTKLPADLQRGDRLVRRTTDGRALPDGVVEAFAEDPPRYPLVLLFTDGSTVPIANLDIPVEVHP